MTTPLEGYRVLDLADEKGAQCVKTLAELGADVIKVETPMGDPMRFLPPFAGHVPHPDRSLWFAYYNTDKRSITLDLESEEGRELFKSLSSRCDVVVESFLPGKLAQQGLDFESLQSINPKIILTSITGFGQHGPRSAYKAPDLVCFAMGGPMYPSGEQGEAPCVAPGNLAYGVAGAWAAAGTILALYSRASTGVGQHVDVSGQEAAAMITDSEITRYSYEGSIITREGSTYPWITPGDLYPCKDGWVRVVAGQVVHWRRLVAWMGSPEPLNDPSWENREKRNQNRPLVDSMVSEFTRRFARAELFAEGQKLGVPVTAVNTPGEYMKSEAAQGRNFFIDVEHPIFGRYPYAGPPYKLSATPARKERPAPLLGQHNEEIYCGELGLTREELCGMRARRVI
ncbi:MAG TPA: CoA transferase [Candidatus Binatia bacterium]|jgi:crotonobetainyl-CoA:carnitine CoA-transferase CaiB-like acyl-CoA transferase